MSHDTHDSHDSYHGTVKAYLVGFVLAVILTVIPFWMVMSGGYSHSQIFVTIGVLAIVQIVVHLKYFLHLDFSVEGRPNTFAFMFTALIILLVVGLSLWLMYAANDLMMNF